MRASPYSDLDRPPLSAAALRRALVVPGGLWTDVQIKDATGSTNADAADAARQGGAEGLVVVAERQTGGRGRLIVGIGLNVTLRADELPVPEATSLLLAGSACTDRDPLLRALLRNLADWYRRWCGAGGDPQASGLHDAYRRHCGTLGREVRVALPDGSELTGTASDVDGTGRLVVTGVASPIAAGDIVHLR